MRIAIDTNILIYAARFKIDIFSQLKGNEIFIPESVIRELEKLSNGKSANAKAAALALGILGKKVSEIKIMPSNARIADDDLLELGKKGYVIVTQDRGLIERLKSSGCKIAYIRQKKYLAYEGA